MTAISITSAELTAGLKTLGTFPWAQAEAAIESGLTNLPDDLVTAEAIAGVLSAVGVPFAGDVGLALKVAGIVLPLAQAAGVTVSPGTPTWSGAHKGSDDN